MVCAPLVVFVDFGLLAPYGVPFMLLVLMVTMTAWLGGCRPALAATALCAAASLARLRADLSGSPGKLLLLFVFASLLIAAFSAHVQRAQAERDRALRESEARFRAVFDSDVVPLVIWRLDGGIEDANETYLRLFGFTRDQIRRGEGMWTDITPPEEQRRPDVLAELASSGRFSPREVELVDRRGRKLPALIGGSALPGHPDLGVAFVLDLSDRQRAERALGEQLALTRAITDNATAGLFMIDENGLCTFMNPAAEAMTGFTFEELRARVLHDMVHHHYPDGRPFPAADCPLVRASTELRTYPAHEDVFHRKGGAPFPVVCAARPVLRAGRPAGVVIEVRDITEHKRADREREVLLDSERAARTEAERASRSKDEFVATLSHELRSPLNAVLGFAQLLRRPARTPEQLDKGLETIARNAGVLSQLISDLLDVSRIATGKLWIDPSPVDLPSVVEGALEGVRAGAAAKGIALHCSIAPVCGVIGDPGRLQQVVWNLASNAIKFTPPGGRVDVALARHRDIVSLTVADTGQGIDPEFLPHIFERFRQADVSTARQHGGLGLGLAIVKHLVELHGGRVRAESDGEGRGSRFIVELPLMAASTEEDRVTPSPSPACSQPSLSGTKILVVDDEPDARDLVRRMLEDCAAKVVTASSVTEALEVLGRERPDVLVSDIGMPGHDGYELIRDIRAGAVPGLRDLPAVALTALAGPEDRQRALGAGFQMHVAKPLYGAELVMAAAYLAGRVAPDQVPPLVQR